MQNMLESSLEVSGLDDDGSAWTLSLDYLLAPGADTSFLDARVVEKLREVQTLIESEGVEV